MAYFTQIKGITNTVGTYTLDSAGNYKDTYPVSGSVAVSGITGSTGVTILNGEGIARDSWVISNVTNTIASNTVDSSGVAYSGTNPFPVTLATALDQTIDSISTNQVSGANFSVYVTGSSGTFASYSLNGDGIYRDTQPISGSVAVSGITGSIGATILNGEGIARDSWIVSNVTASIQASLVDSSGIQYSGSNPVPVVFGATSSQGVAMLDSSGIQYSGSNPLPITWISGVGGGATTAAVTVDSTGVAYSGSNPLPITIISTPSGGATGSLGVSIIGSDGLAFGTSKPIPVTMVAGVSGTTGTANVDSSGVQYSGSNPMPTYLVAGSGNSTISVGPTAEGGTDDGSAPLKFGGIARTTNPTARSDGRTSSLSLDDLGRQLTRPVQVRDLIATAYVNKTTGSTFGTETTLFGGVTNTYNDLIYVLASNDSTVAVGVDIRGTLAGNILLHLEIPANSTTGLSLPVPLPAGDVGASWTIDLPDVTGTNVYVSALFSKEI